MPGHPLRPTPLEVASGSVWGVCGVPATLPTEQGAPLSALEKAIRPALERPPCLVSFSGGRDSSTVLATAARAARREGLDLPVPMTLRFRDAPLSDESTWQEELIRHLALPEWEIHEMGDDADGIGPLAATVLRRYGVLYPPNRFFHLPLLEAARGGSLLTGVGGDNVFALWRWRPFADLMARRRRIEPRDVRRLAHRASPAPLRRAWERRLYRQQAPPWLRDEARRAVGASAAHERSTEPSRWNEWIARLPQTRLLAASCWSFELLATDVDALVLHPLIEPSFLAAVARDGGRRGLGDRTTAMRALFADLLPDQVIARSTKARFDEVFWRKHFRSFAESWTGEGVDADLVDPDVVRDEWLSPSPSSASAMLLQSAWLNCHG